MSQQRLVQPLGPIEAVLFDMDGTLVDSEGYTDRVVAELLHQHGVCACQLDATRLHGTTWQQIGETLKQRWPQLDGQPIASELQRRFQALLRDEPPPLIAGAARAVNEARQTCPSATALVSSSNRESVELLMGQHGLLDQFCVTVCAEDCTRSKPDPQGYLLAARRLGCAPERCLVFEDSVAGLGAAKAAGMTTVAITGVSLSEPSDEASAKALPHISPDPHPLADLSVADFEALAPSFFSALRGPR